MANNRKNTKSRKRQMIQECLRDRNDAPITDKNGNKTYINKYKNIVHV